MKQQSLRLKITLWFSFILVLIVVLTYVVILSVDSSIMQKGIQDNLVETVENNVDEIEFFDKSSSNRDDGDLYLSYGDAYLEIDDDYLDQVNGIYTALYHTDGSLVYGENPISKHISDLDFSDSKVRRVNVGGVEWYVFDRILDDDELNGLSLRGVVSSEPKNAQFSSIVKVSMFIMPALLILAVLGGYYIASRSLKPIQEITATASNITKGSDLKKRIDIGDGDDEIHKLASAFDSMFDRLDASFEAEKQFTSDVSHELRTPMAVIMAQTEFSLSANKTPEEFRDALHVILRQGKKMSRLIEDMLTFSRMERRADSVKLMPLNLSELASSICEDMTLLQDKGIILSTDIQPNIQIEGNKELLTRLLTNLINNSYRYGKDNGWIEVKLYSVGDSVFLTVADNGVGIAQDECEKIFRRFYQSDNARTNSGTGLGLAMAKEIAELHGGTIGVESVLGEGSKFIFEIHK